MSDYRAAFNESLDVQLIIDGEAGRILDASRAARRILGYEPSELVGKNCAMLFPAVSACGRPEWLQRLCVHDAVFESQEFQRANGLATWLDVTVTTIPWAGDQALLATLRDITDRRRAEEQRLVLERHALEAQKLECLGLLAGGMAHEFNNLLTAILGNTGLAKLDCPESGPVSQCLGQIEQSAQQASKLCQQMLAYAGRGPFTLKRISLNALIEGTSSLLRITAGKLIQLRYELAEGLPMIEADPAQLRQAIVNLVMNAAEAVAGKDGVVCIRTALRQPERTSSSGAPGPVGGEARESVLLEIQDNGCGMSADTQQRAFEPFSSTKGLGRGLGLPATLGIIRRHHGSLTLNSAQGCGTIVRILLPVASSDEPRAQETSIHSKGRGTVLVIDDEEPVRKAVSRMLESQGWEAVEAADGREALELFRRQPRAFGAVLLDVSMPRMSGLEVFRQLRQIQPDAPVLFMSGLGEIDPAGQFDAGPRASFLPKPFTPQALHQQLSALNGPRELAGSSSA